MNGHDRIRVRAGDGTVTARPVTPIAEPSKIEQNSFTWDQLHPGHVIQVGRRREVFWIMEREGGVFIVENARTHEREQGTPRLGDMVRVLFPDDHAYIPHPDEAAADAAMARLSDADAFALAGALVQVMLRGWVMGTREVDDPDAPYITPGTKDMVRGQMAAHLWGFHVLQPGDIPDLASPPEQNVLHALHDSRRDREPHRHQ